MEHAKQVETLKGLMSQIEEKRNVDAGITVENPVETSQLGTTITTVIARRAGGYSAR